MKCNLLYPDSDLQPDSVARWLAVLTWPGYSLEMFQPPSIYFQLLAAMNFGGLILISHSVGWLVELNKQLINLADKVMYSNIRMSSNWCAIKWFWNFFKTKNSNNHPWKQTNPSFTIQLNGSSRLRKHLNVIHFLDCYGFLFWDCM